MKKYIFLLIALLSAVGSWADEYVTYDKVRYRIISGTDVAVNHSYSWAGYNGYQGPERGTLVIPASFTITNSDETETTYNVKGFEYWYNRDYYYGYDSSINVLDLSALVDMTSIDLAQIKDPIHNIILPSNVSNITCSGIEDDHGIATVGEITLSEGNTTYSSQDGGVIYTQDGKELVYYPRNKQGSIYTVQDGVTNIKYGAFAQQNYIQKVLFPSTLTTIEDHAFRKCTRLSDINLPEGLQTIGYEAFIDCNIHPANNLLTLPRTLQSIGYNTFYNAFYDKEKVTVEIPKECGLTYDGGTSGSGLAFDYHSMSCNIIRSYMTNPAYALNDYAFDDVNRIYIPKGCVDAYSADGWGRAKEYGKIVETTSAADYDDNIALPVISVSELDQANSILKVTITTEEEGGEIYYKPTYWSDDKDVAEWPVFDANTTPTIDITPNGSVLKAVVKKGGSYSNIVQQEFKWEDYSCKTPVFNYAEGSGKTMTITNSTEGATIYYTLDGSDPSSSETRLEYTAGSEIVFAGNVTYKAVAIKSGIFNSTVVEVTPYWFKCKNPTATYVPVSPNGDKVTVTLSPGEDDAKVTYNFGSGSYLDYTGPIEMNVNNTIYYRAEKANYSNSDELSLYTDKGSKTCVKPGIAADPTTHMLTLTSDDDIYYTTDGSYPEIGGENTIKYTVPVEIKKNCYIYAITHKDGMFQSSEAAQTSINWFSCQNIDFEQVIVGGSPMMKLSLRDSSAVDWTDMVIYYKVNDYYWNENDWKNYGEVYKDPVPVPNGHTIYAIAIKDGYNMLSYDAKTMDYGTFPRCAMPEIVLNNETKTVSITTTETNGKIYYTIDGSYPTANSLLYDDNTVIPTDENITIKAITARDPETVDDVTTEYINSDVASTNLDEWFRLQKVKFIPVLGTAEGEFKMALDAEEGATIEYGINTYGGVTYNSEPRDTFVVSEGDYVYAIARKPGYVDSYWSEYRVSTSSYTVSQPNISVNEETREISVYTETEGASIYYTTGDEEPTAESNLVVDGKVTATRNDQYKFIAVKAGMSNSTVRSYKVDWFRVPQVVITPFGENNELKVELTCEDPDAKIYYGVGSNNFNSNDLTANAEYKEPFKINNGAYIYASAMKDGYNNAYTSSYGYVYDYNFRSNRPTITVAADTMVTITGDADAVFYYTLDGSEPTPESKKYTKKFKLTENTNIRAISVVDRKLYSEIANNNYTGFYCANVVAEQIFDHGQPKIKLTTATPGATIYYGIGYYGDVVYTGPIEADDGNYIYFRARKEKFNESSGGSIQISYSAYTQCSQPSIIINNEDRTVTMETSEQDGIIYYTLDGKTPNTSSNKYTKPFSPKENCTIKAITARAAEEVEGQVVTYANSYVSQRNLDDWFRLSNVKFRPVLGRAEGTYRMVLEAEEGATIEYGINEYGNTVYTDTFDVALGAYVYAVAKKEGVIDSYWSEYRISNDNYTVRQPVIYTNDVTHVLTVTTETEGANIYYTTDGTDPTTSSKKLNGSDITCTRNDSYKFMAAKSGMYNSPVYSYSVNWFKVSDVKIEPYVANNTMMVRISCDDKKATIHYGINDFNSDNVPANAEYKVPFEIQNGNRVYACAVRNGYSNSERAYSDYIYTSNYTCKTPTITIAADSTLTITPGSDDETVYYTLDGTDPTTSSTKFVSKIKLTGNVTIKAIAAASGKLNSSINERNYNNFNVRDINFSLDGTKMTITSTTPGVTFKYQYEAEGTYSMTYPHVYSGPFDLKYNGNIYVLAEKTGYNSTTASNWVGDLVKCKVEKESYDGHTLKLKSDEGNTIWYTTNGSRPYDNSNNWYSNVYKYDGDIEIDAVGTIMAIATGSYRNESDVLEISIDSYAGETGATSDKAGGLETSMGWKKDPENITKFKITGPINTDDMSFIKTKMTSLQHLDLSAATVDDGKIPDKAFADMPLLEFSSPNGLQTVGDNIFTGCDNLAAVVWNTTAKIPDNAFDADVNPNLLLFVPSEDAAPTNSYAQNIIVNGTAKNIILSDGEGNNFHCPQGFYAQNITYTHNFKLESGDGYGWETIALPFECSRFVHESKGELLPFAAYDSLTEKGMYKPFWLRELTDVGFKDVSRIEANKPYIISMPNNDGYASRYRLGGKVTFTSTDTWVPVTEPQAVQKGVNTLYANFLNDDSTDDIMLLNTVETDGKKAGSIFVKRSGRALRPFEAYVVSRANARAYVSVTRGFSDDPDGDDDTTPIETVNQQTTGKMVKVYTLSGVLVKEAAEEDALKGLAKGVYIVNGKSMIVK